MHGESGLKEGEQDGMGEEKANDLPTQLEKKIIRQIEVTK